MKKLLMTAVAMLGMATAGASEVEELNFHDLLFAEPQLTFYQIEQQWHDQCFFTVDRSEKPNLKAYFLSFAQAYPNALTDLMVARMLGLETEGMVGEYVFDERNGYLSGTLLTELLCSVQMCYWRRTDGNILVAVALQGFEYKGDANAGARDDDPHDERTIPVNDLMFFKIDKGEVIWLPKTPLQILGRQYNFNYYDVQLPRYGKDITIRRHGASSTITLRWNGTDFLK